MRPAIGGRKKIDETHKNGYNRSNDASGSKKR